MPVSPGSLSGWSRGSPNPGLWRVPGREEISWVPSRQASVSQTESAWEGRTCRPGLRTAPGGGLWSGDSLLHPVWGSWRQAVLTRHGATPPLSPGHRRRRCPPWGCQARAAPAMVPSPQERATKPFPDPRPAGLAQQPVFSFRPFSVYFLYSLLQLHTWLPPSPATAVPGSQQWPLPACLGCARCAWLSLFPWPPGCCPPRLPSRAVAA